MTVILYSFIMSLHIKYYMSLHSPADTANFQQVLLTLIQGAVEIPDPQGQKTCFNILKRLVEVWGETQLTTTYHTIGVIFKEIRKIVIV